MMNSILKVVMIGIGAMCIRHPAISQDTLQANNHLTKASRYLKLNTYDSAQIYYERASDIFAYNKQWEGYAKGQIGLSRSLLQSGKYNQARPILNKVLKLLMEGKIKEESPQIASLYDQLGRISWLTDGDYETALLHLETAMNLCDKMHFDKTDQLVSIYTNFGYTYGYQGKFDAALESFNKGLELALENYGENHKSIGGHYNNLGFVYGSQGDWEKAELVLKRGITHDIKSLGPEHYRVAQKYNNMAFIYIEKFDSEEAIIYSKMALDLNRKLFGETHQSVGINYMNLAAGYTNKDDHINSIFYSRKAIATFLETVGEKSQYLGTIYSNLGLNFEKLEVLDSALHYYKKALDFRRDIYGEESHWTLNSYVALGRYFLKQGQYDASLQALEKAYSIAPKALPEKHFWLAENLFFLGDYYMAKGKSFQGLEAYQKALIAMVPSFNNLDHFSNPTLEEISFSVLAAGILEKKTQALYRLYKDNSDQAYLKGASETALLTDQFFDIIKSGYQTPESKTYLTSQALSFYETSINIAYDLYRLTNEEKFIEQVFSYFEKNKSLLLLENIRMNESLSYSGLPDSLLIEEERLKRDISLYKEKIHEAKSSGDSGQIKLYENYYFTKKRDLDLLVESFKAKYPEYYKLKYNISHVSVGDIQEFLDPNTTLLEYFYGDSTVFLFCISKTERELFIIKDLANVNEVVDEFRKSITEVDGLQREPDQSLATFAERAHYLYESLMLPLTKNLKTTSKLIIVPDGNLSYLPFELLIDRMPVAGQNSFKDLNYLAKNKVISYAYSATYLANQQNPIASGVLGKYGGFAPSYGQSLVTLADTSKMIALSRMARDGRFDLPGAKEEVRATAGLFNGRSWLGTAATESAFKDSAGGFQILHLALHGLIDDRNPLYSKLVFSQSNDTIEDGFLNAFEIYNLDLNAQLVVLSACNTAYGEIQKGEGVMSLARAFAYAGCPNMVASLWKADDRATTKIMTNFYRLLNEGKSKDHALQLAKLEYLESADANTSHPYYWAAFTLMGNSEPIMSTTRFNWQIASGVLLLLIGLIYFLMHRRRLS